MITAVMFPEANTPYVHDECYTLYTFVQAVPFMNTEFPQVTSCWQFDAEGLKALAENDGKFFISIIGGQPPIQVGMQIPVVEPVVPAVYQKIAKMMFEDYDKARIDNLDGGGVHLTFPAGEYILTAPEWQLVRDLYAALS